MGTPLPENPPGEDGPRCWGPGKAFGDKTTPQIVTITLYDLVRGPLATDADWNELILPHNVYQTANPLKWEAITTTMQWVYDLQFNVGLIFVGDNNRGILGFLNNGFVECGTTAPNQAGLPPAQMAGGGFFEMTYNEVFD